MPKTKTDVQKILDQIKYKDWEFRLLDKGDGFLVQVIFDAKDIHTGKIEKQYCRKFYVSPHMCNSEIIRTAYLAVQQAEMHELNENFLYRETAIYNPHVDVNDLRYCFSVGYINEESRNPNITNNLTI